MGQEPLGDAAFGKQPLMGVLLLFEKRVRVHQGLDQQGNTLSPNVFASWRPSERLREAKTFGDKMCKAFAVRFGQAGSVTQSESRAIVTRYQRRA